MHNEHHSSHNVPGFGKNTNGMGVFIVAAIFVIIGLFVWWLWNNNNREFDHYRIEQAGGSHDGGHGNGHSSGTAALPLGMLDTVTGNYIYELGEEFEIVLPDSAKTKMMVGRNSTEAKLFNFLSNDAMQVDTVDKTKGWITCDRIFFGTNQSTLTDESKTQIGRLGSILKAFGNADIKVGGYTDTTGSADVNTKLSAERAMMVATAIQGASGRTAIASEGYGPLHPIAENATPEGRAMNRRVDIRVIKK
jgi:outer membrane protein OmpA-like peptidoglycan-associated protein